MQYEVIVNGKYDPLPAKVYFNGVLIASINDADTDGTAEGFGSTVGRVIGRHRKTHVPIPGVDA